MIVHSPQRLAAHPVRHRRRAGTCRIQSRPMRLKSREPLTIPHGLSTGTSPRQDVAHGVGPVDYETEWGSELLLPGDSVVWGLDDVQADVQASY